MNTKALLAMLNRDARLFLRSLWRALLLSALFAVLLATVLYGMLASLRTDTESPVTVALVDEDASLMSHFATNFVKNQKDVSRLVSIQNTDYKEALVGIANGNYSGAVVLPDGYLNAIMVGDFVRGKVLLSNGTLINASILKRAARTGERLIRMGQYGVFAGASVVANDPELRQFYDLYILRINDTLMYEASTASDRYVTAEKTAYASSSLALTEHMALILLLALCSFSTLFFYRCHTYDQTPTLAARLLAQGVRGFEFVIPKIFYSFVFRLSIVALAMIPICLVLEPSPLPWGLAGLALSLLLCAAFDTLLSLCLAGNRFGIAILSLFFAVQLFFTGGILPLHYLSPTLRTIGSALPLGLAYRLASPAFGAEYAPLSSLWLFLWVLLACFLAIRRQKHISAEGGRSV